MRIPSVISASSTHPDIGVHATVIFEEIEKVIGKKNICFVISLETAEIRSLRQVLSKPKLAHAVAVQFPVLSVNDIFRNFALVVHLKTRFVVNLISRNVSFCTQGKSRQHNLFRNLTPIHLINSKSYSPLHL